MRVGYPPVLFFWSVSVSIFCEHLTLIRPAKKNQIGYPISHIGLDQVHWVFRSAGFLPTPMPNHDSAPISNLFVIPLTNRNLALSRLFHKYEADLGASLTQSCSLFKYFALTTLLTSMFGCTIILQSCFASKAMLNTSKSQVQDLNYELGCKKDSKNSSFDHWANP